MTGRCPLLVIPPCWPVVNVRRFGQVIGFSELCMTSSTCRECLANRSSVSRGVVPENKLHYLHSWLINHFLNNQHWMNRKKNLLLSSLKRGCTNWFPHRRHLIVMRVPFKLFTSVESIQLLCFHGDAIQWTGQLCRVIFFIYLILIIGIRKYKF